MEDIFTEPQVDYVGYKKIHPSSIWLNSVDNLEKGRQQVHTPSTDIT